MKVSVSVPLAQRPTGEQLDQIRKASTVLWGHPLAAYEKHGRPETRQEASDLLHLLNDTPIATREEETPVTKTCTLCGETKPVTDFYTRQGRCKPCFNAAQKARKAKTTGAAKKPASRKITHPNPKFSPPPEPDLVLPDEAAEAAGDLLPSDAALAPHWCLSELRDPRLSVLRQLTRILDELFPEHPDGFTIDDAALLCAELADLYLS